ncbi:MAG: bacteriohemerythrin [Propionivibrio sp.]|uniref:bacteriohemerythrin n=1 Tax=Propionivibrio sp. TaxID=2212460 RepID=UPI0025F1D81F|nr:bacteriohemerythrin [Propionivibrio sp.]MBL0207373.1 bacteriohemerythrin [Propionivibrio sp.]
MKIALSVLNALSLPAFVLDTEHKVVVWNAPCELLTGIPAKDVIGTRDHWRGFYDEPRPCMADLVLDSMLDEASRFYSRHEKTEFASDGHKAEGWFDEINGKRRYLSFEARPVFDENGIVGAIEVLQDITHHQEAEDQLKLSASVFENSLEGIIITDSDNRTISVNKALESLTGYGREEIIGRNPKLFASDRLSDSYYRKMWTTLNRVGHWQGEIWNRKKTGEEYLVRVHISAVKTGDDVTNYIGLLSDITESNQVMEKMEYMAHHDFLTGLPNRSLLEDRLRQALARAVRNKSRFAVMFIDLDKFKAVNDSLGHHVGDALLKEVTRRIQSCLRASDTISRQGGDEFVLLLEDIGDEVDITHTARKLLALIGGSCYLNGHVVTVTPSIGISLYPTDGVTVADLLSHSDAAMYHAKNQGRNNFQFFTERINAKALETLMVENGLRKAIPDGLLLHYQPQLCLVSKSVHGAEALVRWAHPDLGIIGPSRFISIAEESGLICQIGEWVLQEACRTMRSTGINMSVNLSPMQLTQSDIVAKVIEALDGMAGYRLTLEITESSFIHDFEKTKTTLLALKKIGVNLALDDFGTGYSSLSYLYQLPFDFLKIDQSFISEPKNTPIVLAILEMANKLNIMTVAEGVETPEQMAFLEANGCDVIQGYYFSRPLPLPDLTGFAKNPPYQVSAKPRIKKLAVEESNPMLAWSFTYETGHAGIDAQHKELLRMLNRLDSSTRSGQDESNSRKVMKALIDFVIDHFSFEEKLMHDRGYPYAQAHHSEHLNLVETLSSYDLQLKANAQVNPHQLTSSLHTWLMHHILDSDKKLGEFLSKQQVTSAQA